MPNANSRPLAAALRLRSVSRRFPDSGLVVDRIDLDVEAGEFVALLGPSGCGKSTLLRLAAGLDRPDEGSVEFSGHGSRGFVFQDPCLLPWRSALANAALPLELLGVPRAEARARARQELERVGLGEALGRYPSQLSGGMRMRASLARALASRPSLLLLDEPFGALDENTRHALQEDLRALWETLGMTVIFVTHSVAEATFLAERTIALAGRPTRIALDRKVDLPRPRSSALRLTDVFLRETRAFYERTQHDESGREGSKP